MFLFDSLQGRQKRDENPLLLFHKRTRRRTSYYHCLYVIILLSGVYRGRGIEGPETVREPGRRKGGRLQLRWEDCVKRDIRKAEEDVGFGGCQVEGEDCC